jgi:DNA-binding transcriptional LysR family regulator
MVGRVRIGFLADEYANSIGDGFIASVRREHPRLTIEFQQIDFAEQYSALLDGEVDVSFVMGPVPSSLVSVPLLDSPRLLAASRVYARPTQTEVEASDFAGASVVLPDQMTEHAWRSDWTPPGSAAAQIFVVGENSMEAMLSAVGAGRGVCVVPEYVSRYYPQPGVAFLPVAGLGPCSVEIAALRARQVEPLISALIAVAQGLPERSSA